jgi:hypothetical protein
VLDVPDAPEGEEPNLVKKARAKGMVEADSAKYIFRMCGRFTVWADMRWGLVPYWWNKPLKELRLATFDARVETLRTSHDAGVRLL